MFHRSVWSREALEVLTQEQKYSGYPRAVVPPTEGDSRK